MAKKRTSLDSLFPAETAKNAALTVNNEAKPEAVSAKTGKPKTSNISKQVNEANEAQTETATKPKAEVVKQTVYLPAAVHEQLRQLAFEERKKMHDYLVEGLDRVFKDRGLKSYIQLSSGKN